MTATQRLVLAFSVAAIAAAAQRPAASRHVFNRDGRLTAPSARASREVALEFLRGRAQQYGLTTEDIGAATVVREYRSSHNGVTHLHYHQEFQGVAVENSGWTVNIDSSGQVINAGGALSRRPADGVKAPETRTAREAVRAATRAVNAELAARFAPLETGARATRGLRFAGSSFPAEIEAIPVWFELRGELRAAWKFGITDADGIARYAVIVDATTRRVLSKKPLTWYQSAPRGLVFEQGTPQPNPKPGVALTAAPAVVERTLQPLTGTATASPKGWITGTETSGNNAIAGSNMLGSICATSLDCLAKPQTSSAADGNFSFPLDLGANPTQYADASAVNLFYWVNRAHDLFYQVGFDEAAGNYQQDNYNKGGVGGDPMIAYSLFGVRYRSAAQLNNSAFVTALEGTDGSQAALAFFLGLNNGVYTDYSADAGVVLHEYTHGVSTRLVSQLNYSFQGQAMGEAWSDFFALEFLTPEGAPADGVYPMGEYTNQSWGMGLRTRPYSTKMDVNPLTFAHLGHVLYMPEVHADGEIWFEALWEMRANLIQQLGETEGRRRVRLLALDGMKLSPPAPSMIDMRDAILLADQTDFKGASQQQIWAAFAKRGMGALAISASGDSIHVRPSYETPSTRGAIQFSEDRYVIGEPVRIVLADSNLKSDTVSIVVRSGNGDQEPVTLTREGQVYTGTLYTYAAPVAANDGGLELIAGDFITAFYNDVDAPGFFQAVASVPVSLDYDSHLTKYTPLEFAGEKTLGVSSTSPKPYALPWPFPFYGGKYTQVWVHEQGLLSFDLPSFTSCTGTSELAVTNGIAPLWMDLITYGVSQDDEDVYVSKGTDSVTFRWVAETSADYTGSDPEPVNFAATLYQDGRVVFRYGAGNRNLVGGSNLAGCAASTPTVGISNGHETFVNVIPTHDGKGTLEKATTVVLDPPFNPSSAPVVKLETPADGGRVQGVLTGKGIVYDPDSESAIRAIDIVIDGVAMANATLNVSRTDFCNEQKVQGCPSVGFTFTVPLARNGLKAGDHTLQLRTSNRRGYFVDTPEKPLTFTVDAGEPSLPVTKIESPAAGEKVSGTATVKGYAYSELYRVSQVDVMVDGVTDGRASHTTTRTDICGGLSPTPSNCPRVGFAYSLDTQSLANGTHTISLHVFDSSGRYTSALGDAVTVTVDNSNTVLPVMAMTTPVANQKLSGTVKVSGYAYAPSGKISRVLFVADGYPIGYATYGAARPEACAALADVTACPNIGFDFDYDTTRLSNGPHFLAIMAIDNQGNIGQYPPTSSSGVNVTVEN